METNNQLVKAAEEMLSNKAAEPKPAQTPKKRRENICERWKEAIDDRSLDYEIPLPGDALLIPGNAYKDDAITITEIHLKMKLVYDKEFRNTWQGDYACPNSDPEIEMVVMYQGKCANEKTHVLEIASRIISMHIGNPVSLSEDDWMDPEDLNDSGDRYIESLGLDWDAAWNIADFLLAKHGYNSDAAN